jgi:hypothetical protein
MLFISFIENAFKHGVAINAIRCNFRIGIIENSLFCIIQNRKHQKTANEEANIQALE